MHCIAGQYTNHANFTMGEGENIGTILTERTGYRHHTFVYDGGITRKSIRVLHNTQKNNHENTLTH